MASSSSLCTLHLKGQYSHRLHVDWTTLLCETELAQSAINDCHAGWSVFGVAIDEDLVYEP